MQRQIFWPTPASLREIDRIRRGGRIANPGRAITPEKLLRPDLEYSYTVIEHKEWTSCRAGSDPRRHGPYDTLDEANAVLTSIYERLRHGTEVDGWSDGWWPDGRRWYNCDDWGHEESYKLRIEATPTRPRVVRTAPTAVARSGTSRQIGEDIFTTQSLRRALIKRIVASESGTETAIDRLLAGPRTASELVKALIGAEKGVFQAVSQILDDEDAAKLLCRAILESDGGRAHAISEILECPDYADLLRGNILESKGGREEAVRIVLDCDEQAALLRAELLQGYIRQALEDEDQAQAIRAKILESDTGWEDAVSEILQHRHQAHLFRSELLSADGGIEEAVRQFLSHPSQARRLQAEVLKDVKEEYVAQNEQVWQAAYVAGRRQRWQAEFIAAESAKWREECKAGMAAELRDRIRVELREELRSERAAAEGAEGGELVTAPSRPERATGLASASVSSRPTGVVKRRATRRRA
jgi:hypothetical protein